MIFIQTAPVICVGVGRQDPASLHPLTRDPVSPTCEPSSSMQEAGLLFGVCRVFGKLAEVSA